MAQYFTDFSDQTVGTFPSGFTGRITNTADWEIGEITDVGKVILNTVTDNTRKALTWDTVGSVTDVEIYIEFGTFSGSRLGDTRAAARLDTTKNTSSATAHLYALGYWDPSNRVTLYNNGTATEIANVTFSPDAGITLATTVYASRVSVVGAALKVRTWLKSAGEPGTWDIEITDSTISSAGAVGLFAFNNPTNKFWSALGVGTGGDSAPTGPVSGGTVTGTLSAQETGSDTFSSSGSVDISGSMTAQEAGADVISINGRVLVSGTMAVQEAGSDTFSATGSAAEGITGTMAVQEAGSDTFVSSGSVLVQGTFVTQETGADTFASTGSVLVQGTFVAQEAGNDQFAASGVVPITGTMSVQETGSDTFSATSVAKVYNIAAINGVRLLV